MISHTHTHTHTRIFTMKYYSAIKEGFPGRASGKEPACQCRRQEMWVQSLDQEDPLEKEMATHPSILAWEIPYTDPSKETRLVVVFTNEIYCMNRLHFIS